MKLNFKSLAKDVALGIMILFVVSGIHSYIYSPKLTSDYLPNIQVTLLDGTEYTIPKEKPLVVHFWATWCPTCKLEIANIEHISKSYEVLTIAVNSGEDTKLKAYMKEKGLSFKTINDKEGSWAKKFKIEAYPTTLIYDANRKLQFIEVGYTTTAGLLARLKLIQ